MSKKVYWEEVKSLPEKVQYILSRVDPLIDVHTDNAIYYHDEAVFIQARDTQVLPYTLARLIVNNPDLYFEIRALAPHYIELCCFFSDWYAENETAMRLPYIQKPYETRPMVGSVRVKQVDKE